MYHDQKDGSEFSDVTLASEDDNDNSDVIVLKKFSKGEDLQDALQCNVSRRMAVSFPMLPTYFRAASIFLACFGPQFWGKRSAEDLRGMGKSWDILNFIYQ